MVCVECIHQTIEPEPRGPLKELRSMVSHGPCPYPDTCVCCAMQDDESPIGNTPVIPEGGRRHLLSGGVSTFSITVDSPSTPGPHAITGLFHLHFSAPLAQVSVWPVQRADFCSDLTLILCLIVCVCVCPLRPMKQKLPSCLGYMLATCTGKDTSK